MQVVRELTSGASVDVETPLMEAGVGCGDGAVVAFGRSRAWRSPTLNEQPTPRAIATHLTACDGRQRLDLGASSISRRC